MTTISVLSASIDKPIGGAPNGLWPSLLRGLTKPMFGLLRVLGVAVLVALVLLVIDTHTKEMHTWAQPLLAASASVVVVRVIRVLSLLSNLLQARSVSERR